MRITKYLLVALCAAPLAACSSQTSTTSQLSGHGDNGTHGDCTLTQGYWKNHPKAWTVTSLRLGSVTYTKDELIAILETPVKGNGLIQLSHQLIAAKLNIAGGVSDASIKVEIQAADALIGSLVCPPKGQGELAASATAELTGKLDAFNSGKTGPGHCGDNEHGDNDHGDDNSDCDSDSDTDTDGDGVCEGDHDDDVDTDHDSDHGDHCDHGSDCDHDDDDDCGQTPPAAHCGNHVVETGEACDDGNTSNGDGCSSTCQIEVPVCGNGKIETGETCDDGNTINGDGCSSVCICEPCH